MICLATTSSTNNKNEKLAAWVEISIPDFDGVVQLLCIVIRRQKTVKCARSSLYFIELKVRVMHAWRALTVGCDVHLLSVVSA